MIKSAFIKYILVRYYQHILTNMVKRNKSMHCLLIDLIIMLFIYYILKGISVSLSCPQNQIQQAFVLKVEFLIDIYLSCLLETFLAGDQNLKHTFKKNFYLPNNALKLKICLIVSTPCLNIALSFLSFFPQIYMMQAILLLIDRYIFDEETQVYISSELGKERCVTFLSPLFQEAKCLHIQLVQCI